MQLALPVSVVIAGGIVAAAIVLTRPPPPPPLPPPTVAAAAEVAAAEAPRKTSAEPTNAPVFVPVETPEVRARGLENAARALETYRPRFLEECWNPSAAREAEPRRIRLTFNLSFSPEGELIGVGISEDRSDHRPDVGMCLRRIEMHFKIPAPGVMLQLEVPFNLP